MKILLVEDCEIKANRVISTVKSLRPAVSVTRAKSFIGATREMERTSYDLLILDIVIPYRDDESETVEGGRAVISEILGGGQCLMPSYIICLSAYDDAFPLLDDFEHRSIIHRIKYEDTNFNWSDAIKTRIESIERMDEESSRSSDFNIDVAIVTSSPKVELQQILKLPGFSPGEFNQTDGLHYYQGFWPRAHAVPLHVVACAAPTMGMAAACVTTSKIIERWRPRLVVMSGISAATSKDAEFGDVLVAEAVYDYGSGKIRDDDGMRKFIPSPKQLPIDPHLHAILQKWERDQLYMKEVRAEWDGPSPRVPRLILGLISSGAAVVQSESLVADILNSSRKVVGLEMEAYGVATAATLATKPAPRFLIAKSVSDFANKEKSDDWQRYAAFTSSRFLFEFLTRADELNLPGNTVAQARSKYLAHTTAPEPTTPQNSSDQPS